MKTMTFVGGSLDGNDVEVGEPQIVGMDIVLPLRGAPHKGQVYVLESDGKFHFRGFRDAAPSNLTDEESAAWKEHVVKIGASLMELDAVIAKQGGRRCPITIGRWTLQPRMDD